MKIGDVRVLTLNQVASGLQIPASLASAQYAVVVGNVAVNSGGASVSYTVRGDWLAPGALSTAADQLAPAGRSVVNRRLNWRGAAFEQRLRAFERTRLPRPGGRPTGASIAAADRMTPTVARAAAPPVGTSLQLRVLSSNSFDGPDDPCGAKGYTTTTGTVKAVSTHAIVVSDVASPAGGLTTADFQSVASEFDNLIYPTDVSYFGTPTDLDGNGHVILYYTPAVNKLTPAGEATTGGYTGGFFFAGDLYPQTGAQSCLSSNKGEIFYLLAPDPSGTFGNVFTTQEIRQNTRGTVAHEFQHMINSGNRYVSPIVQDFEATWLDEGLAHFAEDAVGRAAAGFGNTTTVTYSQIHALPDSILSPFFLQNFARAKYYVERPDTTGPIVSEEKAAANLASRGASWMLLRYLADRYNTGGDPRSLTLKLAAGPDTGTTNLVKSTGVPIDSIMAHWLVTLYTDHQPIAGLSSVYNYNSYTLRQIVTGVLLDNEQTASYLPVQPLGGGSATLQAVVPASSGSYFLTSLTTGAARTITIGGARSGAATDPNARVYVVRVK